jgi:hypothetical protein
MQYHGAESELSLERRALYSQFVESFPSNKHLSCSTIRIGLVARICRSHFFCKEDQNRQGRGSIPRFGISDRSFAFGMVVWNQCRSAWLGCLFHLCPGIWEGTLSGEEGGWEMDLLRDAWLGARRASRRFWTL